jgi:hypothetical protein
MSSPEAFFRIAHAHAGLLEDVFRSGGRLDETEMHACIRRHEGVDGRQPAAITAALLGASILVPVPDADGVFELSQPFSHLLAWLLKQQRLTSAAVIRGYLQELDDLRRDVQAAMDARSPEAALRSLRDVGEAIDRVWHDSKNNRDALTTEATHTRGGATKGSARTRFENINRLWSRYVVPLRQLIEPHGEIDRCLDALDAQLRQLDELFPGHGPVIRTSATVRGRLARLRREAREDHLESVQELEPLYHRLRRDALVVQGASLALERARQDGSRSLGIDERMGFVGWRSRLVPSDNALEALLTGLQGYVPQPPSPIPDPPAPITVRLFTEGLLWELLADARQVQDVLAFLLERCPEFALSQILRAYAWVHRGDFGRVTFADEQRRYQAPPFVIRSRPMAVEVRR